MYFKNKKSKAMPQSKRINKSVTNASDDAKHSVEYNEIEAKYLQLIQALPAAIYTCDVNGYIITYNQAAIDLWGREPQHGKDMWCGFYKAYNLDGTPMPHNQSPMATALKEGREINEVEIVIERPDGQIRNILLNPKPFFNASGNVIGGVNMLIDITERKNIDERNRHFTAIVQSSDDAIISKTLDGIITSWNTSAERIFGHTSQEMIGTPITRIIPADRLDEEPLILERLKRGERIDHFETKRVTKDGRLLDISLSISPVKNSKGVIIGASKIARDITAQKIAEQRIRESEEKVRVSEERLRLAVEIAEMGMWDLDLKTGLTTTSAEHRRILGYSKTVQWNKTLFMQMVHPADRPRVEQAFQLAMRTGKISYEARVVRNDNTERWIRVNGTTIYDKKHQPLRLLGTLLDITEQKKAKDELENMVLARTSELVTTNSALEKSNHELEQFAYIASHDLQEPLRKIQTFADMVKENLGDKELTEKYFNKIYTSAKRMSILINDVLNYSRLSKTGEQFETTDLNKILNDVLSDYELLIEQKKAIISHTDLPTIKGIPLQLHQLFANLISNSLKFSEVNPQIAISSRALSPEEVHKYPHLIKDGDYIQLTFTDNGIGFEQQHADQIFIIFQRLNNQRTYSGTGIGLALCKKIVDHHYGIITAQSEPGQGATFTVILPVEH
ncbi:PAS domain S-box protein [Niastella sp. OAS944]|uniref:PAS domain S-box protein n=1 Tax=Niastella sp. OAS944 TaxID=2664089 RepID=UPI00346E507F|nr:PAS domain S-box-containing protein [Chitinophagaceae bacterium OAS944]